MTSSKDTQHGGARPVGWYSRRNQTGEAQTAAKADYIATHATARARIARRARRA